MCRPAGGPGASQSEPAGRGERRASSPGSAAAVTILSRAQFCESAHLLWAVDSAARPTAMLRPALIVTFKARASRKLSR